MPATSQKVHLVACQCSRCEMGSLSLLWPPQGQQKQLQKRMEISKTNWFSESSAFWHYSHIVGFFSTKNLSRKNNPLNIYLLYKKIQGAEDIQIKQKRRELSVAARRACADRIKRNADQHEGTHRTEIPQNHKPIWNLSVFSYKYPAYSLPFEALKHVMGYPISGGTF